MHFENNMHINFIITYRFNYYIYILMINNYLLIMYKYNNLKWVKCIILILYSQ